MSVPIYLTHQRTQVIGGWGWQQVWRIISCGTGYPFEYWRVRQDGASYIAVWLL